MPNTSATGGYLQPTVLTPPAEDAALDAIFQAFVVGVTGLDGTLVRPRWQPVVPKRPEVDVDWCAIGVHDQRPDAGPAILHDANASGGFGTSTLVRHELVEVQASFYGPNGRQFAAMFRDGILIPQNMEALQAQELFYRDQLPIVPAPELINNAWYRRYDISVFFARKISREYAVENLATAEAELITDTSPQIIDPIHVHP